MNELFIKKTRRLSDVIFLKNIDPSYHLSYILFLSNLYKFLFSTNLCRYQAVFLYRAFLSLGCRTDLLVDFIPSRDLFHLRVRVFYKNKLFFSQSLSPEAKFITQL